MWFVKCLVTGWLLVIGVVAVIALLVGLILLCVREPIMLGIPVGFIGLNALAFAFGTAFHD